MAQPAIPNPIKASSIETGLTPKGAPKQAAAPKEATIADIIVQSLKKEDPSVDPMQYTARLSVAEKKGIVKLLKMFNTVFILKPMPDQTVEMHTATIESPDQLVERWKKVPTSLKQMGFKKAISYSQDPSIGKLAQRTGLPIRITQSQRMLGNQMVPSYKFEMDL